MSVPDWVQDAIFYQIFPDRFANGDKSNDPPNLQAWGSPPTSWGFQGGDLKGILQKFDYFLDLGVNALYLNPIFQASSNHRYNTTDFFNIDPKLGSLDDFHELIEHAHHNHVRVILDGVFNHCGRGFFAFNDVLENQEHSAYRDWFHIKNFPVDAYTPGDASDYLGWWGTKSLPKFNTANEAVRGYLLNVARYWIEQGADGWRLDVPNEIDDDTFWAEFHQVVKSANPEAYLVGEIWTSDLRWVGKEHFDGLMNYPVRDAILRLLFAGTLDMPHFAEKIEGLLALYPRENAYAMYIPLGSHDTERLLTKVDNNISKAKLAFIFQFAYPGAPALYYGDEIGLAGGKDPECRAAFPWNEKLWNTEIHDLVKTLITLRRTNPVLRRGDYQRVCMDMENACYAFARVSGDEKIMVALNASPIEQEFCVSIDVLDWKDGRLLQDLITPGKQYTVSNRCFDIVLPPWGGTWVA